jgi:hypothetical protein
LTAAVPIDFLVKLTYYDHVYFNDKLGLFKVSRNGVNKEGYVQVNTLRKYWINSTDFDKYLRDKIQLGPDNVNGKESAVIWDEF